MDLADLVVRLRADFGDVDKKLDSVTESMDLFGESAAETGKAIDSELDAKIESLLSSGMSLAEALQHLADAAATVAPPIEAAGAAAEQAAEQMSLFDEAAHVPYADASGQLNLFTTELEPIPEAAAAGAEAVKKFGEAEEEAGHEGEHAAHGTHELLKELLEFAGIELTIEALKEFAIEAVHVYAETERVSIALGLMMDSAEEAEATIDSLKETAQELGLAFEPLLGITQRFTVLGVSAEETQRALRAAADDAALTGSNIDRVSNSIERMAQTGMASNRQLFQLRLTTADLGEVMGVSADQVTKAFRSMSLSAEDRVAIITEAIEKKFPGAAEAMANSVSGQMNRLKNSWEFALEDMGAALRPMLMEALPGLVQGMKVLVDVAITVATGIKLVTDSLVAVFTVSLTAVKGFLDTWYNLNTGKFKEAKQAAQDTWDSIKNAAKFSWDDMVKDAQTGEDALEKLWAERKKREAGEGEGKRTLPKIAIPYAEMKTEIDAEAAHQRSLLELGRIGLEARKKMGQVSAEEYLAQTKALNDQELEITRDAIRRKLAAQKESNASQINAALNKELQAAVDKNHLENAKADAKYNEERKKEEDETVAHIAKEEDKIAANTRKVYEMREKLDEEEKNDRDKAARDRVNNEMAHEQRLLDNERAVLAERVRMHLITNEERLRLEENLNQREEAMQIEALEKEKKAITDAVEYDIHQETKLAAIEARLQALRDKRDNREKVRAIQIENDAWTTLGITSDSVLKNQLTDIDNAILKLLKMGVSTRELEAAERKRLETVIQMREATGEDASKEIIALTNLQIKQDVLKHQAEGLGGVYRDFMNTAHRAFQQIGSGLADAITNSKTFGQTMMNVLHQIEKELLNLVFQFIMEQLWGALMDLTGLMGTSFGKLAQQAGVTQAAASASDVSQVIGAGAVGGAAAAASIAAIPIVGPGLAIEAGEAMMAAIISTFAPVAAFARGGDVPTDMIAMVHGGEHVVNADISAGLRGLLNAQGSLMPPTAPAGDNINLDFRGAVFGSGLSQSIVDNMMQTAIGKLRRAGGMPTKKGRL